MSIYYLKLALDSKVDILDCESLSEVIISNFLIFMTVVALVPVNWGIESLKWKWALINTQTLSWSSSIKSVLTGVTLSIATPNGVGDYGGRMINIDKDKRSQALYYNCFLSMSQYLITVVFGLLGLSKISEQLSFPMHRLPLLFLIFALIGICTWFYFRTKFRFGLLKTFLLKYNQKISFEISHGLRVKVLMLSMLRYFVFSFQYVLLVRCFIPGIDLITTFSSIAFIFLLTAVIPTGWLSGALVRGSVSFFVFQSVVNGGEFGLIASSLLWVINLLFPAMVGLYFLKSFKLFPIINPENV